MGDLDADDPATMTGPSYRGTGPANRATGPANRGTANPLTSSRQTRVAQAPGPSPTEPQDFVRRTFRQQRERAALQAAQAAAEQLIDELRPFYAARYRKYAGRGKHKPGDRVTVKVLNRADFDASRAVSAEEHLAEDHALIATYIPNYASEVISGYGRSANVTLIPVTSETKLTQQQLDLIRPRGVQPVGSAAGFFSRARDTIFVRIDQMAAATIAHELCHAYESSLWNEFQVALSLQMVRVNARGRGPERLETVFADVDEGLTSMLAQDPLDDWYAAPVKAGMHARPSTPPSALVGYHPVILVTAENFVRSIDGGVGTTAGANSFRAFFGGDITFTIDEADPLASDVRCGGARSKKLGALL